MAALWAVARVDQLVDAWADSLAGAMVVLRAVKSAVVLDDQLVD